MFFPVETKNLISPQMFYRSTDWPAGEYQERDKSRPSSSG